MIETAPPPAASTAPRWAAWDRFLESTPDTGFMQSSWWADFRVTSGWQYFAAVVKQDGAVLGGALVMRFAYGRDRCFYYVPEGPVLPADASLAAPVWDAIRETIEDRRRDDDHAVSHLRIEPRWPHRPDFLSEFRATRAFHEPRNTRCVDLRPPEEAILAQMKPKGRYNVGVARRHGVEVVEDASAQGIADFVEIYGETAARQHLRAKPASYFRTLIPVLSSLGRGSVFFAEWQGRRLAAAVVVYFGGRATYFFGGSLASDRNVHAPTLLHFEIMRRAKAMGHEWYDLWGVAPAGRPDHPWAGISVFKSGFGGVPLDFVPTLDCVYDLPAYDDYVTTR